MTKEPAPNGSSEVGELTEAEIAARFESTVRRMANTKPTPKPQTKARKPRPVKPAY